MSAFLTPIPATVTGAGAPRHRLLQRGRLVPVPGGGSPGGCSLSTGTVGDGAGLRAWPTTARTGDPQWIVLAWIRGVRSSLGLLAAGGQDAGPRHGRGVVDDVSTWGRGGGRPGSRRRGTRHKLAQPAAPHRCRDHSKRLPPQARAQRRAAGCDVDARPPHDRHQRAATSVAELRDGLDAIEAKPSAAGPAAAGPPSDVGSASTSRGHGAAAGAEGAR